MKAFTYLFYGIILFAISLKSNPAHAWGEMGHAVIGAVAEELINPSTKNFVRGILGIEPIAMAANWPDKARDDQRFAHYEKDPALRDADIHDFGPYHYCTIPTGYDYANKPRKVSKDCFGAITHAEGILKNAKASREEKIIALRYLIHIVGDIQQPLHVGNGYDRGGNACKVLWKKNPQASEAAVSVNLHAFWDETIVSYMMEMLGDPALNKKPPIYYSQVVPALKGKHPENFAANAKEVFGGGTLNDWLAEGQRLREESGIYPDSLTTMRSGSPGEEYKNRPYCVWYVDDVADQNPAPGSVIDPAKIPTLTGENFGNRGAALVEAQLLKGGARLASLLDRVAKQAVEAQGSQAAGIDDTLQDAILKKVQDSFRNPR